jgi:hypothetical protein
MTLLLIELPCPNCSNSSSDQPNYCRKCGGKGRLRSTISKHQLSRMGEIPTVLGASIQVSERQPKRRSPKRG